MCRKAVQSIRSDEKYFQLNNVQEAANLILKDYFQDSNQSVRVPIVQIVRDAGFEIFLQDMPANMGGYIVMNPECEQQFGHDRIIAINSNNDSYRRRFTLAHEFGHYLLDPLARADIEYYDAFEKDDVNNATEILVNRFAAELLMPQKAFKEKFDEISNRVTDYYEKIKELSGCFAVPMRSVKIRIEEIGIKV